MPSSSGGPEGGGGGALRPSRYGRANTSTGSSGSGSGNRGSAGSAAADSPERSALAYLLRYEAMVRTQDLEDGATAEHARPLFGRLLFLGRRAGAGGGGGGNASKGGGQDSGKGDGQDSGNDSMCDSASMTSASVKGSIVGEWTPPPGEDQLPEDGIPDLAAANTQSTDEGGGGGEHAKEEQEQVKGAEGGSAAAAAAAAGLALGADDFDDATVLTYPAMARALRRLEASEGAAEAGRSGGDPAAAASRDFLSADRQLMLLLRTTVDAVEEDERTQPQPQEEEEEEEEEGGRGLTYPEFLQAYKIVVGGMQTLQRVPRADASSSRAGAVRASIRERTLELLRLFGPGPSRSGSGCSPTAAITASASVAQGSHLPPLAASSSADELDSVSALPSFGGGRRPGGGARGRTPSISSHHGSVSSQSGTGGNGAPQGRRNGSGTGQYGDPTGLPRDSAASLGSALTDADDVRRVLTLKDKTVLNLLSDHAGEMDDLTDRMVEIVSRGRRRRRRIAALAVAMGAAGLALGTALGRGSLLGGPLGSGSGSGSGSGARPRTARSEAEAGAGGGSGSGSEAILYELRGARRVAGQLRARTKTLERRVADSGAEAARASDDLRGCRTQLAAGAAAAADLRIEGALLAEELAEARAAEAEARAAARAAERATRRRRASASSAPTQAKGGAGRIWREMGLGGDAAEDGAKLARHLSSALWGASGAALAARVALISSGGGFPFAFSGAAVGVVGAVRAAGLGTGIGLGVGAILTGAVPNLLQDE